jgi:hypothetical protein
LFADPSLIPAVAAVAPKAWTDQTMIEKRADLNKMPYPAASFKQRVRAPKGQLVAAGLHVESFKLPYAVVFDSPARLTADDQQHWEEATDSPVSGSATVG